MTKTNGDIIKQLEGLFGHKVDLTYTPHDEGALRTTSGVLREVTTEVIILTVYTDFGEASKFILNRRGCTLHSIVDYGNE